MGRDAALEPRRALRNLPRDRGKVRGTTAIVLASHRVNPSIVQRDWGTISYKVGMLAQCPVLLVK